MPGIGGLWSYGFLFTLLFLGGLGFPVPEEIPLLAGGVFVSQGQLNLVLFGILAVAGIVLGDVAAFSVGRWAGATLEPKGWFQRLVGCDRWAKARTSLQKRGLYAILLARFLPGIRVPMFLLSGISGFSFKIFALVDLAGVLVVVLFFTSLGLLGHGQIENLRAWFPGTAPVLIGGLATGLALALVWFIRRHGKSRLPTRVIAKES
jgi:membrane protein DedA with SNARE-associated domain